MDSGVKLIFPWREVPLPLRNQIRLYFGIGVAGLLIALGLLTTVPFDQPQLVTRNDFAGSAIFAVASLVPLGYAIALLWTRTVIEFGLAGMKLAEWIGPFRRQRQRDWANIAAIRTHYVIHSPDQQFGPPPTDGVIEIAGRGAQPLWVAHDYPREW